MHDNSRAENNNRDRKSISMGETKNNTVKIGSCRFWDYIYDENITAANFQKIAYVFLESRATSQLDVWSVFPSVRERRD